VPEFLTPAAPRPAAHAGPSRLVFNRSVGPGWYRMRLVEPEIARAVRPGQFVQVLCADPGSVDPLLRRPFSVHGADPAEGSYDILYTIVGRGTTWMAGFPEEPGPRAGTLDVIGPFGNTFTPPSPGDEVVLVGGGVGVAPLHFFARRLLASPEPPPILACLGARTSELLQGSADFAELGVDLRFATDDGSAGFRGFVTGLLEEVLDRRAPGAPLRIYGCGPPGMNEALRKVAVARGAWCEICLESRMACGFGICFGCVAPIRKVVGGPFHNRRICWEGPVFDARLLGGPGEGPRVSSSGL